MDGRCWKDAGYLQSKVTALAGSVTGARELCAETKERKERPTEAEAGAERVWRCSSASTCLRDVDSEPCLASHGAGAVSSRHSRASTFPALC